MISRLAEEFVDLLPDGPVCLLSTLLLKQVLDVQIATTGDQVGLAGAHNLGAEPQLVGDEEEHNDGGSEVDGEPALHTCLVSHFAISDGSKSHPELDNEDQAIEGQPDPGTDNAGLRSEGQLVQGVALDLPGTTEADVGKADRAPGEDGRQTRNGHHPLEGGGLLVRGSQEAEKTESGGNENGPKGTTLAVDVGQEGGSLSLLGQGGQSTGGAVDGGVTNRQHGNHDDHVHHRGKTRDTGVLNRDNEGGSLGVGRGITADEALVVESDQQADEGESNNVEDGDTPEDLLDGGGKRLARVGSLSGGQTDQLGTGEGESGVDEHTAKALEAIVERARVNPVLSTDVTTLGAAAAVEDDSEDAGWECERCLSNSRVNLGGTLTTYMKPMTATTLMQEKANSASP